MDSFETDQKNEKIVPKLVDKYQYTRERKKQPFKLLTSEFILHAKPTHNQKKTSLVSYHFVKMKMNFSHYVQIQNQIEAAMRRF